MRKSHFLAKITIFHTFCIKSEKCALGARGGSPGGPAGSELITALLINGKSNLRRLFEFCFVFQYFLALPGIGGVPVPPPRAPPRGRVRDPSGGARDVQKRTFHQKVEFSLKKQIFAKIHENLIFS